MPIFGSRGACAAKSFGLTNITKLFNVPINWTYETGLSTSGFGSGSLTNIVWTGTQFVAVGYVSGPFGRAATSPDGVNWTYRPGFASVAGSRVPYNIIWNGSLYVAGCSGGTVITSTDAITWTVRGPGASWASNIVYCVVWSGTQFVAVGQLGCCGTSPDGITWTFQAGLIGAVGNNDMYNVVWTGSQFVAAGILGKIATSPDGVTWTNRTGLSSTAWSTGSIGNFLYQNNRFITVSNPRVATSTDAINWTLVSTGPNIAGNARTSNVVIYAGGYYVMGGANGNISTSPDGTTWTNSTALASTTWGNGVNSTVRGIAWDGSKFVAVGGATTQVATGI